VESIPQFGEAESPQSPAEPVGLFERLYMRALMLLNSIGSIWIFALMILIVADVVARSGFNQPINGVTDIASFSIIGIVFLQLGATVYTGRMTKGDVLLELLNRYSRRTGALLEALFLLVGAAMFALIVRAIWPTLTRALARNEYFGVEGVFTFPTWPVRMIIVVGAAAVVITYLLQAAKVLRAGFARGARQ
jgi:TRAP-type mannitol/chloroaromatic compound transport system permease small subunit